MKLKIRERIITPASNEIFLNNFSDNKITKSTREAIALIKIIILAPGFCKYSRDIPRKPILEIR